MSRQAETSVDGSGLNPAGTARRRLIKAAGLGAIAGLVSIDWQRPTIRLGSLAAHAEATVIAGCAISIQARGSISETGGLGGTFTLALIASGVGGTTELTSDSFFDVGTLTGSLVGDPSETLSLGFSYSSGGPGSSSGDNLYVIYSPTCCTVGIGIGGDYVPVSGSVYLSEAIPGDDGSCDLSNLTQSDV